MINSIPIEIISTDEPWSIAKLADGSYIRAKIVFVKVARILDDQGKPKFNEDGEPLYGTGTQTVITILTEDEMKIINKKRN